MCILRMVQMNKMFIRETLFYYFDELLIQINKQNHLHC